MTGESILIVADEPLPSRELATSLEQLGYKVRGIVDAAADAFAFADIVKLDMALVDIHIKGELTGIDVARRLRAQNDVPVVFLAAHADAQTVADAMAAEPFGCIVKPFCRSILAATMKSAAKRRTAEQRLSEMRQWLHVTMQNIADAVVALDSELRVTFANTIAEQLTGWTLMEAMGQPASEVLRIRTPSGKDVADLIGEAMQGAIVPRVDDATLLIRNGTELWIDGSIAPIMDDSGRASGWVITFRDKNSRVPHESQVRQLETEFESRLREQTARLEATNQELSAFAQNIAHDVRMPLRAINWFASRLTDEHGATLPSAGQQLVARMLTAANQLASMTEGYLRLSGMTTTALNFGEVDMERLAREAWSVVVAAESRRPAFSATSIPAVHGDEALLSQVWVNLLSNAVKFSRMSAVPSVQVTARDAGGSICFRVEDNGVGFDSVFRDRVFEPFERLHEQPEFEGSGLGLSIVQRILRRHDGGVSIDSSVGKGAAVEFWLPKQQPPLARKTARVDSRTV